MLPCSSLASLRHCAPYMPHPARIVGNHQHLGNSHHRHNRPRHSPNTSSSKQNHHLRSASHHNIHGSQQIHRFYSQRTHGDRNFWSNRNARLASIHRSIHGSQRTRRLYSQRTHVGRKCSSTRNRRGRR
jgi:hypothetical protein